MKILQRLIAEFGEKVTVDGALGPATAAATRRAFASAGHTLVDAYGIARAQLLFPHRRPAPAKPQIRPHPRRQQGRLDQTGRGSSSARNTI